MMNYARATTHQMVHDLTIEELDYRFNEEANSIGMLLAHMASVEKAYQILTFENREPNEEDIRKLNPALDLGKHAAAIAGNPISYYLEQLQSVRDETLKTFQTLPDGWLYDETPFWRNLKANNYFKWFHVFEDEINHRGQIRLIRKMYKITQMKNV